MPIGTSQILLQIPIEISPAGMAILFMGIIIVLASPMIFTAVAGGVAGRFVPRVSVRRATLLGAAVGFVGTITVDALFMILVVGCEPLFGFRSCQEPPFRSISSLYNESPAAIHWGSLALTVPASVGMVLRLDRRRRHREDIAAEQEERQRIRRARRAQASRFDSADEQG